MLSAPHYIFLQKKKKQKQKQKNPLGFHFEVWKQIKTKSTLYLWFQTISTLKDEDKKGIFHL